MLLLSLQSELTEFEDSELCFHIHQGEYADNFLSEITDFNIYYVLLKFEVGLKNERCVVGEEGLIVCI